MRQILQNNINFISLNNLGKKKKEKKIVLISPRVLGAKGQIRKAPPPFGIAVLAASLIKIGYSNVHLIDAVVEDYDNLEPVKDNKAFITFGLSD